MSKKSIVPLSLMTVSLIVFLFVAIKVALATVGYVTVTNGYQILVNQGIVSLTAQTRSINIDTSKVTQSFFIPTKTINEVDSYLASALHTVVQNSADVTPPTIYPDAPHLSIGNEPAYELDFYIDENGFYGASWHLHGSPSPVPTATTSINAEQTITFLIGHTADTGYDYTIVAKDASNNESSYSNYVLTSSDTQAPVIADIMDTTPGEIAPPASDISFTSDEDGEYQIVYAESEDALPEPGDNWLEMSVKENVGVAGDDKINTNFVYIIYARDAALNVSDSGILAVGDVKI